MPTDEDVYEDVSGGWTTHVAGRRLKHRVPNEIKAMWEAIDWGSEGAIDRWGEFNRKEREWRESLPSDEFPCNYYDPNTKTSRPGTMKVPRDSEYIDLLSISDYAGQSFNDPTPGECADRLEMIRNSGLNVPQYAIDALRKEQADRLN